MRCKLKELQRIKKKAIEKESECVCMYEQQEWREGWNHWNFNEFAETSTKSKSV